MTSAEMKAYIESRTANPSPAEPVAPDTFDALEEIGDLLIDSEACAGCGALPGDGYTAGCWHSTGCGYLRELELEQQAAQIALAVLNQIDPELTQSVAQVARIVLEDLEQMRPNMIAPLSRQDEQHG
jgi:hypothetical protein